MKKKRTFWIFSIVYVLLFTVSYIWLPYLYAYESYTFLVPRLALITGISIFAFLTGLNTSLAPNVALTKKMPINFDMACYITFFIFILVVIVTFATASRIPIIESLKGASSEDLSIYREDFLKARQGWEASLNYILGAICGGILPYLIAIAFYRNHRYKFFYALIFLFYSISFLEKAYFFKIAIPVFFIYFYNAKNKSLFVIKGLGIIVLMVVAMYTLAGPSNSDANTANFFSIRYIPSGTWDSITYRSVVVPIVTTLDSLRVFAENFKERLFYGTTSSFVALITGQNSFNFDRFVYQFQFGGSETGASNATYLIESFINFGYTGVAVFAFVVGKLMRLVIREKDIAAISVLPLFILNLYSASLIGTLLSGGFIFFFIMVRFFKFK